MPRTPRYVVARQFFSGAEEARAAVVRHLGDGERHGPETHQIWNYWYLPGMYTYLRTEPTKVLPHALCERFRAELGGWAFETLGLADVVHGYLSLYVAGCMQSLHNDAENGSFGYVYSLTPTPRTFLGGETLLMRDARYFGSERMTRAAAGSNLYELVPPDFDQLVVFDDRVPHAVQRIEGSMDPLAGRVVLHGHLRATGPVIEGSLADARPSAGGSLADARPSAGIDAESAVVPPEVEAEVAALVRRIHARVAVEARPSHGLLSLRCTFGPDGVAASPVVLCDRVMALDGRVDEGDDARTIALAELASLRVPVAAGVWRVTLPLVIDTRRAAPPEVGSRAVPAVPVKAPAPSMAVAPGLRRWIDDSVSGGYGVDWMLERLERDGYSRAFAEAAIVNTLFDLSAGPPRALPDPLPDGVVASRRIGERDIGVMAALGEPRVVVLRGVLSDEECDALVARAKALVEPSKVVDQEHGGSVAHEHRTSSHTTLRAGDDPLLDAIEDRISALVGWPRTRSEAMQVTHYARGAEYRPHHDYFPPEHPGSASHIGRAGNRVATLVVFLETPLEGGATVFPELHLEVAPVKGNAVFFSYPRPDPSTRTLHGGAPVVRGDKWIATKWFREHDLR